MLYQRFYIQFVEDFGWRNKIKTGSREEKSLKIFYFSLWHGYVLCYGKEILWKKCKKKHNFQFMKPSKFILNENINCPTFPFCVTHTQNLKSKHKLCRFICFMCTYILGFDVAIKKLLHATKVQQYNFLHLWTEVSN